MKAARGRWLVDWWPVSVQRGSKSVNTIMQIGTGPPHAAVVLSLSAIAGRDKVVLSAGDKSERRGFQQRRLGWMKVLDPLLLSRAMAGASSKLKI